MNSVLQEFNADQFNFTKVNKEKEVVAILRNSGEETAGGGGEDVIIINVSPIDRGHCLLVPQLDRCLPQVSSSGFSPELTDCDAGPHPEIREGGAGHDVPLLVPRHEAGLQFPLWVRQRQSPSLPPLLPVPPPACPDGRPDPPHTLTAQGICFFRIGKVTPAPVKVPPV